MHCTSCYVLVKALSALLPICAGDQPVAAYDYLLYCSGYLGDKVADIKSYVGISKLYIADKNYLRSW